MHPAQKAKREGDRDSRHWLKKQVKCLNLAWACEQEERKNIRKWNPGSLCCTSKKGSALMKSHKLLTHEEAGLEVHPAEDESLCWPQENGTAQAAGNSVGWMESIFLKFTGSLTSRRWSSFRGDSCYPLISEIMMSCVPALLRYTGSWDFQALRKATWWVYLREDPLEY